MRHLKAHEHRCMPWKNGLGETTEIAISPKNATLESFDWRISMASVPLPGPFSRFSGIDRTLLVLGTGRLDLTVADRGPERLDGQSRPFAFSGDADTQAALPDGPIRDLNVMCRRGRYTAFVERLPAGNECQMDPANATSLLLAVDGSLSLNIRNEVLELSPLDAVLFTPTDGPFTVRSKGATQMIWVRLSPVPGDAQ